MAKQKKPTPHAKKPAPAAKKAVKKPVPKKVVTAPAKKPAPKPAPTTKQAEPPKPKPAVTSPSDSKKNSDKKESARELLRSRILGNKKSSKPIAFSLEEVREIAKTTTKPGDESGEAKSSKPAAKPTTKAVDVAKAVPPAQPNHIKAASLSDILGFNPKRATKPPMEEDLENIPEKFRRYYKLLIDLRTHLTEGITLHSEETLKRSSKDDAGDLSSYGQHMADAGTDTFDRDFALSLVSSEQEALTEIDAAIKRIKDGTYGTCEITGKPIAKERLSAVPFTRYSAEAQKDIERNRMRTRTSAGLFGELGEDGAKIEDGGGDDE
jgi:RNA polymerase-binding transcription factor DksA